MPKRKEPPLSDAEQRKRFEALAREVGASASSKQLRETIKRVAPQKAASTSPVKPQKVGR